MKGRCPHCKEDVLDTQARVKDDNGDYFHAKCDVARLPRPHPHRAHARTHTPARVRAACEGNERLDARSPRPAASPGATWGVPPLREGRPLEPRAGAGQQRRLLPHRMLGSQGHGRRREALGGEVRLGWSVRRAARAVGGRSNTMPVGACPHASTTHDHITTPEAGGVAFAFVLWGVLSRHGPVTRALGDGHPELLVERYAGEI